MRTAKQIAASRANGEKSRGPVTPEGKAVSSRNALKFGLYASHHVIPGEDPAAFEALVNEFHDTYRPANAIENALVVTLIRSTWLLTRLERLETELWDREMEEAEQYDTQRPFSLASIRGEDHFKLLTRRRDSAIRALSRATELLAKLKKPHPAPKSTPQPIPRKPVTPSLGSFRHLSTEAASCPDPRLLTPVPAYPLPEAS